VLYILFRQLKSAKIVLIKKFSSNQINKAMETKDKVLASSGTTKEIIRFIEQYFYSNEILLIETVKDRFILSGNNRECFYVEKIKNRYLFKSDASFKRILL